MVLQTKLIYIYLLLCHLASEYNLIAPRVENLREAVLNKVSQTFYQEKNKTKQKKLPRIYRLAPAGYVQ